MTQYSEIANPNQTPQREKARATQVENHAGGFVFEVTKWSRLDRFLVIGAELPTYYAGKREHALENIACVEECLAEDGPRTVARIVEISDAGRAPKNDPAIFALAMATVSRDPATRHAAHRAIGKVCRIGTHLFHYVADVKRMGEKGHVFGRSLRRALASWYTGRNPDQLAHQAVKYQQRDGWSHGDILRLAHPVAPSPQHQAAMRWMISGMEKIEATTPKPRRQALERGMLPRTILAFEEAKTATAIGDVCRLAAELPHEAIPNEWKKHPELWEALLPGMGMTAMIRNLAKMTAVGLLKPMSAGTKLVVTKLADAEALRAQRIHPMAILIAAGVYRQGHGEKGSLTWTPVPAILDALDQAFYLAFKAVEPTGKNHLLAVDISPSMDGEVLPGISARLAAAVMALVTAKVEPWTHVVGFCTRLTPIDMTRHTQMGSLVESMSKLSMGNGTDCSQPMLYAMQNKIEVDTFEVLTDNETWAGSIHAFQALRKYRALMGRPQAKLVVAGFTGTEFTIADPSDPGMLDVVGLDSAMPSIVSDFSAGRI